MRLFVTGAGGGLGTAFLERAAGGHEVRPFSRADLDVGDPHAVMTSVRAVRPHAVLNLAAMTKVDACEGEPAEAGRVNAVGAENVALAASETGAVLLHVSTDYVFDGDKTGLYDELDRPNPISVYGRTKLAGEEAVRRLAPGHFIVRTSYVFGGGRDYASAAVQGLGRGRRSAASSTGGAPRPSSGTWRSGWSPCSPPGASGRTTSPAETPRPGSRC